MIEYIKWKNAELQAQLRARTLPYSGSKAILVRRLQDSDIFPTSSSPEHIRHEDPEPLPENFLEQMKESDPRIIVKMLRKLLHDRNVRKKEKEMQTSSYGRRSYGWGPYDDQRALDRGKCLERTCPLCGMGDLSFALCDFLGFGRKCSDDTCKDFNNCAYCREELLKLEAAYIQRREGESCVDGSCGDLSKCLRCENHVHDSKVSIGKPNGVPRPLRPRGNATELREVLTDMGNVVHNEYLDRLLQRLQNEQPDAAEWVKTKQKLKDGKCLGAACSSCGTAMVTESLEALSAGKRIDCGGSIHNNASEIITCSSCRQHLHDMEDNVSRFEKGSCISGRCGMPFGCAKCQNRPGSQLTVSGPVNRSAGASIAQKNSELESLCLDDENCTGVATCGACKWEKFMEKEKRKERALDDMRARRFERLGHCDGPDPDLPYGLGCRLFDCNRCRMIEAKIGPKERNDKLRQRRVEEIKAYLSEGSDVVGTGNKRKRSFSDLEHSCKLHPENHLAKRVREERHREKLERQQARLLHKQPSWFGTPEDPFPDRWMGRPVLSKEEIKTLKVMSFMPKYYLAESKEHSIALATDPETKKFCTIILRLEAELMSRDFWMQSLGYDADDGHGKFIAGEYWLEDSQSESSEDVETHRVESWLSTVPRS